MQQTININDNLFNNAAQCLGMNDLNSIVDIALRELIENHQPARVRRQPPTSIAGKAKKNIGRFDRTLCCRRGF